MAAKLLFLPPAVGSSATADRTVENFQATLMQCGSWRPSSSQACGPRDFVPARPLSRYDPALAWQQPPLRERLAGQSGAAERRLPEPVDHEAGLGLP
jgi:hypothetical protein